MAKLYDTAYQLYQNVNKNKKKANANIPVTNTKLITSETEVETPTTTTPTTTPTTSATSVIPSSSSVYDEWLSLSKANQNANAQAYQAKLNTQKYMPNMLAAQGLAGQGVSESTLAGINNTYASNVANNNSAFIQGQAELKAQDEDKNMTYATSQLAANAPSYTTEEQWKELYDTYANKLNTTDRAAFDKEYNDAYASWAATNVTTEEQERQAELEELGLTEVATQDDKKYTLDLTSDASTNTNFNVNYGDKAYELELGANVSSYGFSSSGKADTSWANGEVRILTEGDRRIIAIKDMNGDIRAVEPTGRSRVDFENFAKTYFGISDWNTVVNVRNQKTINSPTTITYPNNDSKSVSNWLTEWLNRK